ncbi:OB-fold domain-containing protein [Phenylobacterium sp.]|uniref:Zn-ribbon domain-containing OB-fold protein n=1 Tax=Phenylobacterium sp. TaxID=1871053 RepID=UPI002897FD56|nr:OB-fold domain-containing protein [Phenylobacterium sp.]
MSYLPTDALVGDPEPWEQPFWDFCAQRSLRFQTCADCGVVRHPPMPFCGACNSPHHLWKPPGEDAELFTFTIVRHASHASLAPAVPYNAAVVMFPGTQSVRLVSNIVNCANEDLRIGMKLSLVWEAAGGGRIVPRFEPASRS